MRNFLDDLWKDFQMVYMFGYFLIGLCNCGKCLRWMMLDESVLFSGRFVLLMSCRNSKYFCLLYKILIVVCYNWMHNHFVIEVEKCAATFIRKDFR